MSTKSHTKTNARNKTKLTAKKPDSISVKISDKENSSPSKIAKEHSSNKVSGGKQNTVDPHEKQMFMNDNWWDNDRIHDASDDEMFPATTPMGSNKSGQLAGSQNKSGHDLHLNSDDEDLSYLHTLDDSNDSSNNDYSLDAAESDIESNNLLDINTTENTQTDSVDMFDNQVADANLLDTDLLNTDNDLMDIDTSLLDNDTSLLDIEKNMGYDGV